MTKKQKKLLRRIIFALAALLAGALLIHLSDALWCRWAGRLLALLAWFLCGWEVAVKAVKNIGHGQLFDENFLMTLATVGAFALGDFVEGGAVMLFFQVGELFQSVAVERSRRSVAELMDLRPDVALVLDENGQVRECDPEEVEKGELLQVLPGQRIPVDGIVESGSSAVDTARITGESVPADVKEGDRVLSGCINISGVLTIRAESAYASSTVAGILSLMESATEGRSKTESFITRFARYYTPCVVTGAVLLALLPPFFDGWQFAKWISRALNFLVVSCPCALVISVPLSFFGGMGAVSRAGMIAKGGIALENLSKADAVALDKTGTLTTGSFSIVEIQAQGITEQTLLWLVAGAESASNHPIGKAIASAGGTDGKVEKIKEIPGKGIFAVVDGHSVYAGNMALMEELGFLLHEGAEGLTAVYAAVDGAYAGCILLADTVKSGAQDALRELQAMGIRQTVMLTGDRESTAKKVADTLHIRTWYSGLLPQDKVEKVRELKSQAQTLIFVGDGVNDAPVLALADIGVAMGGIGSDAAVEAADLVLLKDDLRGLPRAISIARKTMAIARENVVFALAVKFAVLLLSILGEASMWLAVFADVGVAVLAILNAARAGGTRK